MSPKFESGLGGAERLDSNDPLERFRSEFYIPRGTHGPEAIYLCGNSLGLMPRRAREYVTAELDDWATLGVEGHFHGRHPWLPYHEFLTADLAVLTGAGPTEIVAMNSLTVNLHLMMFSFYRPTLSRYKILMGFCPFPSDRYAIYSQIRLRGFEVEDALIELEPRPGESIIYPEDIERVIAEHRSEIALVLMEGVNYYSGQAIDFKSIAQLAHQAGANVGFDLAHAIGNLPLRLHDWQADFAIWCSYKYLNGGPGCVGGAFVHERHGTDENLPKLWGWWGQSKDIRFKMGAEFRAIPGIESWQLSNPAILPLAALRASLEIFRDADIAKLRVKSIALTGYLEFLLKSECGAQVEIITPSDPEARGAQLSLRVKGGRKAFENLTAKDVVCDWREPDVIRIAPVPLYNTFDDVYRFVQILKEV